MIRFLTFSSSGRRACRHWLTASTSSSPANQMIQMQKNSLVASPVRPPLHCKLPAQNTQLNAIRFASSTTSGPFELVRSAYVHPLSQIVLEYLQNVRHDWVVARGLEHLTLHRDGSFELKFNQYDKEVVSATASKSKFGSKHENEGRIWTFYDEVEKKHWLTVQTKDLHERYLLQDNLLSAWHGNRKSIHERIHEEIEEMIQAIDEKVVQDHHRK